jgi:putative ABC transport system permease protein
VIKLWILAWAGVRKAKSVSVTLVVLFVVAALLLNLGLLIALNYTSYFDKLKQELNASDAYLLMPRALFSEGIDHYFEQSAHVTELRRDEALLLSATIESQGIDKDFAVLLRPLSQEDGLSRWKHVGAYLPPEERSVYVPDLFKAVSGYQLNDAITLEYQGADGSPQSLSLTVRGYTEDIFFSSTETGPVAFYVPEKDYPTLAADLGDAAVEERLVFMNLDDTASMSLLENDVRALAGSAYSSVVVPDTSSLLGMLDVGLVDFARCIMASMVAVMIVVFALMIVAVCLLVVWFRIVNSIEDDLVRIGSLKSVGFVSKQIVGSVLLQFIALAGLGSLVGIVLSYPVLPIVSAVFEQQSGLLWEQGFDALVSAATFGSLLLVVMLVALWAARKVYGVTPVSALCREPSARRNPRSFFGLDRTPGALSVILALKSVAQGLRQTLMILVIVAAVGFAGAFGVIMYYNSSIDTKAFSEVPGIEQCNVVASLNPQLDHTAALEEIKGMEGVRKIQYVDEAKVKVQGTVVTISIMSDFAEKETRVMLEGRYPEANGEIAIAGVLAERLGKKVGDTVTVQYGLSEERFSVVGLSNGSQMGGLHCTLRTEDFKRLNPEFKPQTLYVYLVEGVDAAAFSAVLEGRLDQELLKGTVDFDRLLEESMMSYQGIVSAMGLTILVVTLLVIAFVLYFVIASSVIRRKHELGIKKTIGFTTLQLMNQVALGFAVPVACGMAAGCALGALLANPLLSVAMRSMGVMRANFVVDPPWIVVFGVVALVFAYLLSLVVTWRIRKISAYALVTD